MERLKQTRKERFESEKGLMSPSERPSSLRPHIPFSRREYDHRDLIPSLYDPPWSDIVEADPSDLCSPDPLAPSKFRDGGYAVWDAAVGIGDTAMRTDDEHLLHRLPVVNGWNGEWIERKYVLGRAGLGSHSATGSRPEAMYLMDLTRSEYGWSINLLAHALAHTGSGTYTGEYGRRMMWYRNVCEICAGIMLGIPVDLSDEPGRTESRLPLGLRISVGSSISSPTMMVPMYGGSPRPDDTLAVICAGMKLEPEPYGYARGTSEAGKYDMWSMQPSAVVLAGWDAVDTVMHRNIARVTPDSDDLYLASHPEDMTEMSLLPEYIEAARSHACLMDGDYTDPVEFLSSDAMEGVLSRSNFLPCGECVNTYMHNRPPMHERKKPWSKDPEWMQWKINQKKLFDPIEKAAVKYERWKVFGSREKTVRLRKEGAKAEKARRDRMKEQEDIDKIIMKRAYKGENSITSKQQHRYLEYRRKVGSEAVKRRKKYLKGLKRWKYLKR